VSQNVEQINDILMTTYSKTQLVIKNIVVVGLLVRYLQSVHNCSVDL